jgi:hypothetical protein
MQQVITKPVELASRGTECPFCGDTRQVDAGDGRKADCPQCCKATATTNQLITKGL